MTRTKSKKTVISALMIIVVLLSMTSIYADTPSITIKLQSYDNLGNRVGVNFSFYKVGNVDESTYTPVFDSKFGIKKPPKTAEETKQTINNLKSADKSEPVITGVTSSDGTLTVNVERGIYYIESGTNDYGVIEPSLVWVPYNLADDSGLSYNMEIVPKAEANSEVAGQTQDPIDESQGEVQGEEGMPATDNTEEGSVKGEEAKTFDNVQLMGIIGLALISIIMVIFIIMKKNKRKEQNDAI